MFVVVIRTTSELPFVSLCNVPCMQVEGNRLYSSVSSTSSVDVVAQPCVAEIVASLIRKYLKFKEIEKILKFRQIFEEPEIWGHHKDSSITL